MRMSIKTFKSLFPRQAEDVDLTPVNFKISDDAIGYANDNNGRAKIKDFNRAGSKYSAVKTKSGDGNKFDSRREHKYYAELLQLKKAGIVNEIILQPEFELQEEYVKDGKKVRAIKYIADFKVLYADGTEEIVDVKGFKNRVYELKKKLFHYKYPNLTIKEIR